MKMDSIDESTDLKRQAETGSLNKAIQIMEYMAQFETGVTLSALSEATSITKSTLIRLMKVLRGNGYIVQDPRTRMYRLGWSLIYVGEAAKKQFDIVGLLKEYVDRLAKQTGETSSLLIIRDVKSVNLYQASSSSQIGGIIAPGTERDLHISAAGKMLLASLKTSELERTLKQYSFANTKQTDHSIISYVRLLDELEQIRKQGYALDDEEFELGCRCIAAPILSRYGYTLAVLAITGPAVRITKALIPRYVEVVCRVASEASESLVSPLQE